MNKKRSEPLKEPAWLNKVDSNAPAEDMKILGTGTGQNKDFFLPKKKKVKIDQKVVTGHGGFVGISNHSKMHQRALSELLVKISSSSKWVIISEYRIQLKSGLSTYDLIPDLLVYKTIEDELPLALIELVEGQPEYLIEKYKFIVEIKDYVPELFAYDFISKEFSQLIRTSNNLLEERSLSFEDVLAYIRLRE